MTITFYRPGSVSTMWPPGDATPLHAYRETPPGGAGAGGWIPAPLRKLFGR
jgi:hypothetical protein